VDQGEGCGAGESLTSSAKSRAASIAAHQCAAQGTA
jgi:hypothetical protein